MGLAEPYNHAELGRVGKSKEALGSAERSGFAGLGRAGDVRAEGGEGGSLDRQNPRKINFLIKTVLGQNRPPNPFQRGQKRVPQVRTSYAHLAKPLPIMIRRKKTYDFEQKLIRF